MDKIKNVEIVNMVNSQYVTPYRVLYEQNGKKKLWDGIKVHDSVAILIFNKTRSVFIFVKQFRPVVYVRYVRANSDDLSNKIDTEKYPGSLGLTYELCAGIIDKNKSVEEIAKEEILEECGYDVPVNLLEKIVSFKSGVGVSGGTQIMYYAEITDNMRVSGGGGCTEEGEMIEVIEIPLNLSLEFAMDESKTKPVGMIFAIHWFHMNKKNYLV